MENPADELWEVTWRESQEHPAFSISYRKVEGIAPKQPQASKVAYRPPNMRNRPAKPGLNLHENDEPAENQKKAEGEGLSKSSAKNRKRRENKKKSEASASELRQQQQPQPQQPQQQQFGGGSNKSETEKQMRKLKDKLAQIEKLKEQQKEGKTLELNQLEKLKRESELVEQLNSLMKM